MKAAKKVMYYQKNIMYLGLIHGTHVKNEGETKVSITLSPFQLVEYSNSSYARNPEERKLMMRYSYLITGLIVSWCNKKQKIVWTSITKDKYIVLGHISWEAI